MAEEYFDIRPSNGGDILSLQGEWVIDNSGDILAAIKEMPKARYAGIDATGIARMDTWGSLRVRSMAEQGDVPLNLSDRQKRIFDFIEKKPDVPEQKPEYSGWKAPFIRLGALAVDFCKTSYGVLSFIGEIGVCFARCLANPSSFRFHSIVRHIDETGFRALPIIGLLAVLISMVISYQAATQLQKFGANIFTVDLTVISLLREMGVLITAIMVAGRSGSAFAAEIGVMKLREEVDALKTMGMDPIEVLVLPRLLATMLTLPILTFLADIIGLAGGAVISVVLLDIPLDMYIDRVDQVAKINMFLVGMIKAPVFAFIITIIGAYQGMNVTGSAESVGKLTTLSVVQSIFLVILVDALFSVIFSKLGI